MAGRDNHGYGKFRDASALPPCDVRAHQWAYRTEVGPVPPGLQLDHLCRNPLCVNPKHLEVVTQGVNVLRGVGPSAINAAKTHCIRGHLFDKANTRITKYGHRQCRACHNAKSWQRRLRIKRAALEA